MSIRKEKVLELFNEKYSCSQAIFLAYSDIFKIERETALKISSGFGGGIGGLGKTCGAINAAIMLIGLKYGNIDKQDVDSKIQTKKVIRNFINDFNMKHENLNCCDLLQEGNIRYPMHSEKCLIIIEQVCDLIEKYLEL